MAITYYSEDDDLLKVRPNILSLGVGSWEEQHIEAFELINRTIIARWYKPTAVKFAVDWRLTEFDPDLVDSTQLVKLSCYKVFEMAYTFLMKDTPEPDGFDRHRKHFGKQYSQELRDILSIGVSYDWNADDEISSDEKYEYTPRRIYRT
jgi:hypothetical protein